MHSNIDITKKSHRRVDPAPRSAADEALVEFLAKNLTGLSSQEGSQYLRDLEARYQATYTTAKFLTPTPTLKVPKDVGQPNTLDQWVEVAIVNGQTVTIFQPSNQTMLDKLSESTPDLVYRRLFFRCPIPSEYAWFKATENQRANGGTFIQRLTPYDFRATVAKETHGHLVNGSDPRPRPKSRGACHCHACVAQTKRLEAAGIPYL